jgi:hypothetical protein
MDGRVYNFEDINAVDENGNTQLWHAVQDQNTDKVKELLEKGANPNTVNKAGQIPLATAAYYANDLDTDSMNMKLLLAHGANPNIAEGNDTPLDIVCNSSGGRRISNNLTILLIAGAVLLEKNVARVKEVLKLTDEQFVTQFELKNANDEKAGYLFIDRALKITQEDEIVSTMQEKWAKTTGKILSGMEIIPEPFKGGAADVFQHVIFHLDNKEDIVSLKLTAKGDKETTPLADIKFKATESYTDKFKDAAKKTFAEKAEGQDKQIG